jgi:hypothetical protein
MKLEETRERGVATWFTLSLSKREPQMTCMAYWTGFEIDSETNTCKAVGSSGCSNPFRFKTDKECRSFFRLK